MYVKIFESNSRYDIEKQLNNFLKNNKEEIIDIKYTEITALGPYNTYSYNCSAMVIFK